MDSISTARIRDAIRAIAQQSDTLLQTAQGCRASNFTALQCAPELFLLFPSSSAATMAAVLVEVWACELSGAGLTAALQACLNPDGSQAYTAAQIAQAVAASMSLVFLDVAHVPTPYGGAANSELRMIGLAQGDLAAIKPPEGASFLVISCLPGDYAPTPGSLIAALQSAYGINVAALAANPAADFRSTHHCWISQNLVSGNGSTVPYQQLICFESTGADAPANISGVFDAIKSYVPNPPPLPNTGATVVSALLSTGSAGADPAQVLTALFNGCWNLMTAGSGYNMTCFRVVVYSSSWAPSLTAVFDQLKQSHGL